MADVPDLAGDMGVGEITSKKTMFGRTVFVFDGNEYDSEEAAKSDRKLIIERRRTAQAAQQEQDELAHATAEIYDEYDASPEIMTVWVQTQPNTDKRKILWGLLGEKETGLAAFVDMEALNRAIYEVSRDLSLQGYEVFSITPVEAGVGAYQFPAGKQGGGAGWGYSFTQGVIVTARRRR